MTTIQKLAIELCPDYPDIETANEFECSWALRCQIEGIRKAVGDWQAWGRAVMDKTGLSEQDAMQLYDEVIKSN